MSLIKNNTIVYGWSYPSMGGHIGIFVGRNGTTIIDSNVFAFLQTEAEEDGIGVKNTFGNDTTVMKNNVFFSCVGGFYKYMDSNKASLVVWKAKDFNDLNDEDLAGDYMLAESGNNREADPGLRPDKDFATKFTNFIASQPGKLNMDAMNEWRRSVGLPLQGDPGSARGIERRRLQDRRRLEVAMVERRIHRGREPDEAAARPLAEGETEFEFGGRLVDLIHHDRVAAGYEPRLEPAARNARGHDHDVPAGRFRCRLALPVHDADLERHL